MPSIVNNFTCAVCKKQIQYKKSSVQEMQQCWACNRIMCNECSKSDVCIECYIRLPIEKQQIMDQYSLKFKKFFKTAIYSMIAFMFIVVLSIFIIKDDLITLIIFIVDGCIIMILYIFIVYLKYRIGKFLKNNLE